MNKSQLVHHVWKKTKLPKEDVWMAVDTTLDCIKKYTARRGGVSITGFGTFQCYPGGPQKKYDASAKRYRGTKAMKQVLFTPTRSWWKPVQG